MRKFALAGLAGVALLLAVTPASAVFTQCPPEGLSTGCSVLITVGPTGSISTAVDATQSPYFTEDVTVGVQNNSSSAVTSMPISSSGLYPAFSFDSDGICSFDASLTGCDSTGYGPNGITFSGISASLFSGTVNFPGGGIAPGASAWFSLEGNASNTTFVGGGTPEPGTLILLGTGVAALCGRIRRRRKV